MRTTRSLALATSVLLLTLGLAACGSDGGSDGSAAKASPGTSASDDAGLYGGGSGTDTQSGGTEISIKDFAFSPATLDVKAGDTVTVTNDDSAAHTWTLDDGSFDAGTLAPGKSVTHTFDEAGSFAYHCEIHPNMKGTVEVG